MTAWLDARAPDEARLHAVVDDVLAQARAAAVAQGVDLDARQESVTPAVDFDAALRDRLVATPGRRRDPGPGAAHRGRP